jgi:large subunit ribosomal protein L22
MSQLEAHHNFARISARKARYVADLVRGHDVNSALDILNHTHRRGSFFIARVLRSAIANATQEGKVNANKLFIRDLQIDGGPLLQGRFRYQSGPMGRALPIRKRTSHIHVVLGERGGEGRGAAKTEAAAEAKPKNTEPKNTEHKKTTAAKKSAPNAKKAAKKEAK